MQLKALLELSYERYVVQEAGIPNGTTASEMYGMGGVQSMMKGLQYSTNNGNRIYHPVPAIWTLDMTVGQHVLR